MSTIKRSRKQLSELGIDTHYAVAGLHTGKFIIMDTNPDRAAFNRRKPQVLPMCHSQRPVKYNTYNGAFDAIVASLRVWH